MNLRDHREWDRTNGLLSVSLEPRLTSHDNALYVMLNGSSGNFCLDYNEEDFNKELAMQRAWSSDTGYYIKILPNNDVKIISWWNGREEVIPSSLVTSNPQKFYRLITKEDARIRTIIAFAKEAFVRLRNCIQIQENGQESLRCFMYLLAALEDNVEKIADVDSDKWKLSAFDSALITPHDWEFLYNAFKKGINPNGLSIQPDVRLVLRHASNRLFQEAHREATRKTFQMMMFGGADRKYDGGISDGAYYTPTPLVRTIVQEALWALNKAKPIASRTSLHILDPACGSAEFLREILRQLKMLDYVGQVKIVGWDISPIACEMAKFVLHHESQTEWEGKVEIIIELRNSLDYDWSLNPNYDVILMNPPFISFENLGTRKKAVQDKLSGLVKGQPDAGAVFWKNASDVLKDQGVLGLVLPHSFLSAETYDKLRLYFKEIGMEFSLVGRLGSAGLFEKAMIIPGILIGTKKIKAIANTILWTDYQQSSVYEALRELRVYRSLDIPTPIATPNYSIYENEILNDNENGNLKVVSFKMYMLEQNLKDVTTVGKLFNVKRGIDTGNNPAFLLKKIEWLELPKKERQYFRPTIMRSSIQNGRLIDNFYCFYPYGKYNIETEKELGEKVSKYYTDKLLPNKPKLKKRGAKANKWWELNRHRPWLNKKESRLVSSYFGKAGYFAFDESGEYLLGQSFVWEPKKDDLKNKNYQLAYLALLHAPMMDLLFEMMCNILDGGYYDFSKHYVDKVPIPDLSTVDPEILNNLSKNGDLITSGLPINRNELNEIVANAYGLNLELIK